MAAARRARWSRERRLDLALELLADPVYDRLITGASALRRSCRATLARLADAPGGALCHIVRYRLIRSAHVQPRGQRPHDDRAQLRRRDLRPGAAAPWRDLCRRDGGDARAELDGNGLVCDIGLAQGAARARCWARSTTAISTSSPSSAAATPRRSSWPARSSAASRRASPRARSDPGTAGALAEPAREPARISGGLGRFEGPLGVTALALLVPGPIDQLTGGYLYARHLVDALRARGRAVAVRELAGRFPDADAVARAAAAAALAGARRRRGRGDRRAGARRALPIVWRDEARRLRLVGARPSSARRSRPGSTPVAPRASPRSKRGFCRCSRASFVPARAPRLRSRPMASRATRIAVVPPGTAKPARAPPHPRHARGRCGCFRWRRVTPRKGTAC